ncbi:transmembrane protein, putative (macronuclear) [Tetrahymena thermophila SB210]|uniref:Transmembrane protein, putative n=1 Tax=Tetrahymena thermophila (strain SB210) TaxID=312017 RepID=I7ME60_TETTS|nr:transmembrane protein, putative [Tetrahymena thermophila SB210]EAR95006.1 transmembrane protein, putative [Tetrahymena thermophila SB210]|eukprot:XP_001015251.1 transmembrane protein, putative [Tetrahymena thermophila SB210]
MIKMGFQPSNSKEQVELVFFKKWNIIYRVKFYQNKKVLYLCHLIQFILALTTLSILYAKVNTNFKYGIYLSPICLIYSFIQIIFIKKTLTNPRYHWLIQFILLAVLLSVFLGVYFYIYNPTFKQMFNEGQNCKIIKDSRAVLKDGSYLENFQVLTVQFNYNGQTFQGCGCGSDKYEESIYQTKIEPFRYVSNEEMTALNEQTMKEEEDISTIKMPSWMCQPFTDYQTDIKGNGSQNKPKVDVETCYFNFYGVDSLYLDNQNSSDYCKKSESFVQVIFKERPYFPVDQFCLLLIFTLLAIFSFCLNWILVIIVHYLLPCLRVEVEQDFFKLDNKNLPIKKSNKVIPTQNLSKSQPQKIQQKKNETKQNEGVFYKIKKLFDYLTKPKVKTLPIQKIDIKNDQQTNQQQQTNRKSSLNNSQLAENKILITQQEKDGQSNPQSVLQINNESCCDEKYTTQIQQPVSSKQQQNVVFFSLPPAKKKLLPPIEMNINYDEVIKENTKKEIEEKKTIGNSPVKESQKIKNQQSIDVPDLVISQNHHLHSILLKGAKKGLNQTFSEKKKSKVKFVSHKDLDQNPIQKKSSVSESNIK